MTYVNANRLDFVYTFVKHLIALGQRHYLIGALDEKALRGLQARGIPCFFMDSGLTTNDYGWGTYAFRQLGLHKVQLVLDLAKTGVDALTVDADAFVLRDPAAYFRALPDADVLMSSDHLTATNGYDDDGLEGPGGFYSAFNIGYIFIRARAIEFVEAWRDTCYKRKNDWDQVLFARCSPRGGGARNGKARATGCADVQDERGAHLMAGVLPVSLFASGHTFFVSRMAHLMHQHPYMVHTTFQYGGAQGKRHRLREAMMWEDDPEYYAAPISSSTSPTCRTSSSTPRAARSRPTARRTSSAHERRRALRAGPPPAHADPQRVRAREAARPHPHPAAPRLRPRPLVGAALGHHPGLRRAAAAPRVPGRPRHRPRAHRQAREYVRARRPSCATRARPWPCCARASPPTRRRSRGASPPTARPTRTEARIEGSPLVDRAQAARRRRCRAREPPPDYRAVLQPRPGGRALREHDARLRRPLVLQPRRPAGRGAGHIWYDYHTRAHTEKVQSRRSPLLPDRRRRHRNALTRARCPSRRARA